MNSNPPLSIEEQLEATSSSVTARALNRREALTLLGSAAAFLAGCSGESAAAVASGAGGAATGAGAAGAGGSAGGAMGTVSWARGGTQVLGASYPDPFSNPLGSSCSITCREVIGPCYASSIERRDISEGYPGLPVRLMLLVVDENCEPIAGANVDVWHTRNTGLYSGDDAGQDADGAPIVFGPPPGVDAGGPPPGIVIPAGGLVAACTSNDPDALSHRFFRGTQTTDATGRVQFDTCYPGWYLGRALHIHFIVRLAGRESVISQLYFEEELTSEICAVHPDYASRAQPDTVNSTDAFYSGAERVLSAAQQADGSMLAWKTIVLRNSFDEASCGSDLGGGPRGAE